MRYLIINADGYGFTAGITRAIEECIAFGTVRSVSVNVNFSHAGQLARLVKRHPDLSVGCHINPVVGKPVLPPDQVRSLLDGNGDFLYRDFPRRFMSGSIRLDELRREMTAQVEKTRDLAGRSFSHVDFHAGYHRFPGIYRLFLEVAERAGVRRIRTHKYLVGMESQFPRLRHVRHLLARPTRLPKFVWNYGLRWGALRRGFAMPDRRVEITEMVTRPGRIRVENYLTMLRNLPGGYNEFVAHPGYVDEELKRWSSYVEPRILELRALLDSAFRNALSDPSIQLAGYRDISMRETRGRGLARASSGGLARKSTIPKEPLEHSLERKAR
ncbi:MAG: carbohydrate deacetylase [Candidatus Binatia bacterium]